MATKTFKIGEYAVGGIVVVSVTDKIRIEARDWDTKKLVEEKEFIINEGGRNEKFDVQMYLECEITSSYYAEKIMEFIYPAPKKGIQ